MPEEIKYEKFPHLLPEETKIWSRFLNLYKQNYLSFAYDVHVGEGHPTGEETQEKYIDMWGSLTPKRIDVVGFYEAGITIFEIRPNADMSMLGKLLGYKTLYLESFVNVPKITLAIVTDRLSPDDAFIFSGYSIQIFIV